jgi:hypothetical protein
MNNSLRVSSTVSLCGIIGGLAFTVTPALAEEPAERSEVASVEESTAPQLRSEDATNPGSYPAEPDSGSNVAAQGQTRNREPRLGGHVGIATPFVTLSSETTTIADQFTLLHPIGISVKFDKITVDFETVVVNPIEPSGNVGLVIDPGVVYNFGPVAAGLRLAWQQAESNFGLIPLVNKGIVDIGEATWFVEAAFPTFYSDSTIAFNMVLHSGVGF